MSETATLATASARSAGLPVFKNTQKGTIYMYSVAVAVAEVTILDLALYTYKRNQTLYTHKPSDFF